MPSVHDSPTHTVAWRRHILRRLLPAIGAGIVIALTVRLFDRNQNATPLEPESRNNLAAFERILKQRDNVLHPIVGEERSFTTSWEVGDREFGQGVAFGRIEDIAVDGIGRVYVLDNFERRLVVLDSTGVVVQVVGRQGRGPGEFFIPEAVAVSGDTSVFMWDIGNQRLNHLRWRGDSLVLTDEIGVQSGAFDICVFSDAIVFVGEMGGHILHEYTYDGAFVQSIGVSVAYDHAMLSDVVSGGKALCSDNGQSIIVVSHWLPDITAYGRDGTLQWATSLSDFQIIQLTPKGSTYTMSMPTSGFYHYMLEIGDAGEDTVFVQVGTLRREHRGPPDETPEWATYVFDVTARDSVLVLPSLPRLNTIRGHYAIGTGITPVPAVARYAIKAGEDR